MSLLDKITSPADVKALTPGEVKQLASEIREFLVDRVSRTGGHLGPNLGVVELSIAMHRVFNSPKDSFVFDTGHQSYVHKLLTGRKDFSQLRKRDGISGYPCRSESEHDIVENSHASTSLSWADGISRANEVLGHDDRHVVAVIGDGALTGGMAWEALNNIAESQNRKLIIIVNDNGRSYSPTIGGLALRLDSLRTSRGYERFLRWGKRTLHRSGPPGRVTFSALHGMKRGLKDFLAPNGIFHDLGIKYIGAIDGHDAGEVEYALRRARDFGGPVIVHILTEKGRGYTPAEQDLADHFHAVGQIHPETGLPLAPSRFGWTSVFADEIVQIGRRRPDVVAITAAMLAPVGLAPFAKEFPDRIFDVGIAEQHAATAAAGMAYAGLHPVVSLYATFLNRAFDQVLMDVALHKAPVTFTLDRSGITGDDGASHNGMWDLAMLQIVPGIRVAAPRDEQTLRLSIREAIDHDAGPSVVRYPKGPVGDHTPAIEQLDGTDILFRSQRAAASDKTEMPSVLLVGVGAMARTAMDTAELLAAQGISVTVASPTWVLPIPDSLIKLGAAHSVVISIEDGLAEGGIGTLLGHTLRQERSNVAVHPFGLPKQFIQHASRDQLVQEFQLTPGDIARDVNNILNAQRN